MTTMWELINAARAAHGLPPYAVNTQLTAAASRHAWDIATNDVHTTDPAKYHEGSDGSSTKDRITMAGYPAVRWGEVTGWGFGGDRVQMLNYWLNSPAHRALILSADLTQCGIVLIEVPNSKWRWYWVIDFGRPEAGAHPSPYVYMPVVVKPAGETIDLLPYLRGDGRIYHVLHANGAGETFQTQIDGNVFYQGKNEQWEKLWIDGPYIWRGVDTSPGPLHGRPRAYTQRESNQKGSRWIPRYMAPGETWHGFGHTVEFRYKDNCEFSPENSGPATNVITLVQYRPSLTFSSGITVEGVVELRSRGTNETMIYGYGYGLIGWRNDAGQSSEIIRVYAQGEQANLVREEVHCFD